MQPDEPIRAGETARRVVFTGIKIKWVTLGYTGTVALRDPKNKGRVLDCEAGGSDQSICSFTTETNPFPTAGTYKIQLLLTKGNKTYKGKVQKITIEASN